MPVYEQSEFKNQKNKHASSPSQPWRKFSFFTEINTRKGRKRGACENPQYCEKPIANSSRFFKSEPFCVHINRRPSVLSLEHVQKWTSLSGMRKAQVKTQLPLCQMKQNIFKPPGHRYAEEMTFSWPCDLDIMTHHSVHRLHLLRLGNPRDRRTACVALRRGYCFHRRETCLWSMSLQSLFPTPVQPE